MASKGYMKMLEDKWEDQFPAGYKLKFVESINENGEVVLTPQIIKERGSALEKKIDYNEPFYTIRGDGVIDYFPNGCLQANSYLQFGNYFKTKEEAEFAREKHLISTQLREYAEKHSTKKVGKPFVITLNNYQGNLEISTIFSNLGNNVIRFASVEVAEDAIKHIGTERLIKYYFGV